MTSMLEVIDTLEMLSYPWNWEWFKHQQYRCWSHNLPQVLLGWLHCKGGDIEARKHMVFQKCGIENVSIDEMLIFLDSVIQIFQSAELPCNFMVSWSVSDYEVSSRANLPEPIDLFNGITKERLSFFERENEPNIFRLWRRQSSLDDFHKLLPSASNKTIHENVWEDPFYYHRSTEVLHKTVPPLICCCVDDIMIMTKSVGQNWFLIFNEILSHFQHKIYQHYLLAVRLNAVNNDSKYCARVDALLIPTITNECQFVFLMREDQKYGLDRFQCAQLPCNFMVAWSYSSYVKPTDLFNENTGERLSIFQRESEPNTFRLWRRSSTLDDFHKLLPSAANKTIHGNIWEDPFYYHRISEVLYKTQDIPTLPLDCSGHKKLVRQ
ncbi:hypothetical protein Ddc_11636 [Ditylenchus destructor]|nr:hypothetical protein Ddc_11636 [Ditylenchus destructor]